MRNQRRKQRKNTDLGVIFSMVTTRKTKRILLTDFYKMLGLNYYGDFDCVWTIGPDGETKSFETVPYAPDYDDIFENDSNEITKKIINYDGNNATFKSDKYYLKGLINDWRNGK